ncbi:unnamed protein product [Ectocarpus sp. CCAP 1310/34]|nr:unnamed protein product [Ectocarpus sp. CCAP 1310/34]
MRTSHGIFRIVAAGRRALTTMLQQQARNCSEVVSAHEDRVTPDFWAVPH